MTKAPQIDKFKAAARDLECNESEEGFDAKLGKLVAAGEKKVCPECGHIFKGNGWDGIDAHWRSKHESVMPYEKAWPLLSSGKYK